jgi:hypothetical protein
METEIIIIYSYIYCIVVDKKQEALYLYFLLGNLITNKLFRRYVPQVPAQVPVTCERLRRFLGYLHLPAPLLPLTRRPRLRYRP